jgi:FKBP12-rapamycin complex-associated protein
MADESYDSLPLLHKVEVFQYALDNTTGQDLYRILWLKSRNSEAWLERRVTYTRSLGVNSMVGYILGLGDRHPSNLLLDQVSGKIVHIDFVCGPKCRKRVRADGQGDCFEIAQQRDKYPEKVPFRLTRMLIHAMEVSSFEHLRHCQADDRYAVSPEPFRDHARSRWRSFGTIENRSWLCWRPSCTTRLLLGV